MLLGDLIEPIAITRLASFVVRFAVVQFLRSRRIKNFLVGKHYSFVWIRQAASSRSARLRLSVAAVILASRRSRLDWAGGLPSGRSRSFGVAASTSQIRMRVARLGSRSPVA